MKKTVLFKESDIRIAGSVDPWKRLGLGSAESRQLDRARNGGAESPHVDPTCHALDCKVSALVYVFDKENLGKLLPK